MGAGGRVTGTGDGVCVRVPGDRMDGIEIYHGDAGRMPYPDDTFDCLVTDPPYGYGFMGKDWDKAVIPSSVWREVLRVMKPGAFGFVMSAPRQDVLSRMIVNLQDAGFEVGFSSIYWTFATGFPKAANVGKMVDKRLGLERKVVGQNPNDRESRDNHLSDYGLQGGVGNGQITAPASPLAKELDGAYAGFSPKPAVEVILVVMKPKTEKSYLDQAMKDGKGVTWLDSGRIPYPTGDNSFEKGVQRAVTPRADIRGGGFHAGEWAEKTHIVSSGMSPQGRFPANLLVSDDLLDDGVPHPATVDRNLFQGKTDKLFGPTGHQRTSRGDTGTFSRYFSLDAWAAALPESVRKTFPFLICPKPSKAEKNRGCECLENETYLDPARHDKEAIGCNNPRNRTGKAAKGNTHPCCKPIKLMSYLIAIGSRPGDLIIDPFMGSGTTLVAAKAMRRRAVGVDNDAENIPIAEARVAAVNRDRLF